MLAHIARYAEAKAGKTLESIESHENHAAIELEREMGFSAEPYPGDATLVLVRRKLTRWPMHSLEANHIGKSPGVHSAPD